MNNETRIQHDVMSVTQEERDWAIAIKEAVQKESNSKEIYGDLSDMDYIQHAIVAKEKVPKALKRMRRLKAYKMKHNIQDTVEESTAVLQRMMELSPGFCLSFGPIQKQSELKEQVKDPEQSKAKNDNKDSEAAEHHPIRYMIWYHYKSFLPSIYEEKETREENKKILWKGVYYMIHGMQPNVQAIRNGCIFIMDCENFGMKNFSFEMEKYLAEFYQDSYPLRVKEMVMLSTPKIFEILYNLCKVFLSEKIRNIIHMNDTVETLKEKYSPKLVPDTMEGGQFNTDEELIKAVKNALSERYDNCSKFKL